MKMNMHLTFNRELDRKNPRPLLRPLIHQAGHLPAIVRRRGNQAVLAEHRHRAVWPIGGGGRVVASHRCEPFDGGSWLPVYRFTLGHHHRLGTGLDGHNIGRVLRFGWRRRDKMKIYEKDEYGRLFLFFLKKEKIGRVLNVESRKLAAKAK